MGPETKFYQKLRKNSKGIIWNRIENLSSLGTPDLLGYNTFGTFFTVELKVTKGKGIRFSPHQIAFHKSHPTKTFIMVQAPGPGSLKHVHMFQGSRITELAACGLTLDACWFGLEASINYLKNLN